MDCVVYVRVYDSVRRTSFSQDRLVAPKRVYITPTHMEFVLLRIWYVDPKSITTSSKNEKKSQSFWYSALR